MSLPSDEDEDFHGGIGTEIATIASPGSETQKPRVRRVVVIEGPDTGKVFTLDPNAPSRVLLGTSPACELRLTDPRVSRRHAAFEPAGRRYRITDFGSTNGTFVDGVAIVDAFVGGDEIIRCGSSALRLEAEELPQGEEQPPRLSRFGSMIGSSIAMRRLYPLCERIAKARVPVIIEGETGTGKEVLAESLHEVGGSGGPFVVFDCTAVSPALMEAELFGHERGAFTGAVASRAGVFEEANGGTLFIDEIGDLELALQAKLLRILDRGELRRVGGTKTIKVNVRVLSATRRDLDKAVAAGRFRDDLFHRLAVARIELPPLRDREEDVLLLARHFATEMTGSTDVLTPELLSRFTDYSWPGNVRELRNAVARFIALGETADDPRWQTARTGARSTPGNGDWLEQILATQPSFAIARRIVVNEFERRYVEKTLAAHDGNVAHAARSSGLALRYFRIVKARQKAEPRES